ncbi:MAG: hypothetical protein COW71_14900 [Ignavibacteriales bacterium CG18_big_fil_WC_8_21_14_2_50_31_20]|nr:MAG: hypothetical protein COW71_14900 [Ignavibacteriales bacterium CG18_big_fil_WC_8_21_14_2_50_31_20]
MKRIKDISLEKKMIFVIIISVLIPLILAISVIIINVSKFYRDDLIDEAELSAKIIADFSVADIQFNSQDISNKSLSFIGKNAKFLRIVIFKENGEIFSEFIKETHEKNHIMHRNENISYYEGEYLYTYQIIKQDAKTFGTICIVSSTELMNKKIIDFLIGAIILSVIILFLAILLGQKFTKSLLIPIENLVKKAGQITNDASYDIQLQKFGNDEIGKLYDSLNIMLSNINERSIERDKALNALKISENNFKEIFNSSHDAIVIHDLNMKIVDANETMLKMFEISNDELTNMSVAKELSSRKNDFDLLNVRWQKVLNNQPQEFNWISKKPKTNEEFVSQVNIKKIVLSDKEIVIATIRDITELEKANDKLRNSENKLQKIFDILQVGAGLLSGRNIVEVNNKMCELIGYSREELVGYSSRKIYKSEEHFLNFGKIIADNFSNIGSCHQEVEWVRKDGKFITVILDLMPLSFENSVENFILFSFLDITELKMAEREIKELNSDLENRVKERTTELELANKELEAFSYSVSHDLRTPLRGIREFSKIILEENMQQLNEEGKKYLLKVINNTISMKNLIDDLLNFSRLAQEKIVLEKITMETVVNSVINTINDSLPNNNIKFIVHNCDCLINADPNLLRIAVFNLFSNAVKFTSKNENPIIEFGKYNLSEAKEKFGVENIVFYIKDNGVGFDMEHADKLFGAFQRFHSKKDFEGFGIGLATVNKIISKHNGQIWATSELNKGATFFFTIGETTNLNL